MIEDKKTILIAEDEEDLREMYVMTLFSAGFEVLEAVDGSEVMEHLEKNFRGVDLILLDIVMPGMDGFEALEKIKKDERFNRIPILVSTNLDNDEDRIQALRLGAMDYFVKSNHTPSELVSKINGVLNVRA